MVRKCFKRTPFLADNVKGVVPKMYNHVIFFRCVIRVYIDIYTHCVCICFSYVYISEDTAEKFPAHKNILMCASPVFFTMFTSNFVESSSSVVKIDDTEPAVFSKMLK